MFGLCFIVYLIVVSFEVTFEPDWNPPRFLYWLHTVASPVVKLHTPPRRWCFDRRAAHILPIIVSLPSPVIVIDCSWNTSSPLRPHSTKVAATKSPLRKAGRAANLTQIQIQCVTAFVSLLFCLCWIFIVNTSHAMGDDFFPFSLRVLFSATSNSCT